MCCWQLSLCQQHVVVVVAAVAGVVDSLTGLLRVLSLSVENFIKHFKAYHVRLLLAGTVLFPSTVPFSSCTVPSHLFGYCHAPFQFMILLFSQQIKEKLRIMAKC